MDIMSPTEWIEWRKKANNVRYVNQYGLKGAKETDTYAERIAIIGSVSGNYVNDPRWDMPNYGGLSLIDWQKEIFQTALAQNYNLSVSSGNKNSNFRASLGYVNQEGIVIKTGFERINLKMSAQTTIKDKLTLGFDLAPQFTVTKGGNVDGKDNTAQQALTLAPVAEAGLYTSAQPYTRYLWAGSTVSPIANMEYSGYRDEKIRLNASAFARYQILPELTAEVLGSWLFVNSERHRFTPSSLNRYWASYPEGYYSNGSWTGSRSHKYLGQATATYNKDFGKQRGGRMVCRDDQGRKFIHHRCHTISKQLPEWRFLGYDHRYPEECICRLQYRRPPGILLRSCRIWLRQPLSAQRQHP